MAATLWVMPPGAPPLPDEPLVTPATIAARVFGGNVRGRWVLEEVPYNLRHRVGRLVLYRESEVRTWADTLREGDGQ